MIPESYDSFVNLIDRHRSGDPVGIYSVCSANKWVIRAAMDQARADDSLLLVEATCNQVNQFGGYTGKKPLEFVEDLHRLADRSDFPRERLLLGGDHLGPSAWQKEPAEQAMSKSRDLVTQFVESGFSKIHLDTSMPCSDDPRPLPEETVAERSADLCSVAEKAQSNKPPLYIVGTEVPTPGGALEDLDRLQVTGPEDVARTIEYTRAAFLALGLKQAWERVIGVVVQPGVEFGNETIVEYDRARAQELSRTIEAHDGLVYEAHSTDYQPRTALKELVEDHFCILKVGPALTFAFREAVFALAAIEEQLASTVDHLNPSGILEVLENTMIRHPEHWKQHYSVEPARQAFERRFSLSDRIRYYWDYPEVQLAVSTLIRNLDGVELPLPLLSQYLPVEYQAVRAGELESRPNDLIQNRIRSVLKDYSFACGAD